jgi:hypothetical protein
MFVNSAIGYAVLAASVASQVYGILADLVGAATIADRIEAIRPLADGNIAI